MTTLMRLLSFLGFLFWSGLCPCFAEDIAIAPSQDIWTTSIYSFAPVGGGPGGGLPDQYLKVGGWGDLYYSLLQFDVNKLPKNASSVSLELFNLNAAGGTPTGIFIYYITRPWNWETQGTGSDRLRLWWADRPSAALYKPAMIAAPGLNAKYSIDLTQIYNDWQNGTIPNYGIELRPSQNTNNFDIFASSRFPNAALRPKLVVTTPTTLDHVIVLPQLTTKGRRVALVIANSAYRDAPLSNPLVDGAIVEDSLRRIGFSVALRKDLDLDAFEQAISEFAETAKGADIALFYFAGHGFSVASGGIQQNLLMTTSTNFSAKTSQALLGGGEPLEHVEEMIIRQARATLIFVDACRNIPALAGRGSASRGFAPLDADSSEGAYVVLSTRQGRTAEDGDAGRGSPFARAFAAVVPTPGLRIEDAYARIREKVRLETSGEQVPDVVRSDLPEGGVFLSSGTAR